MRKCFAMMAVVLLAGGATDSLAKDSQTVPKTVDALRIGEVTGDLPAGGVPQSYTRGTLPDTLCFGYVDGGGFAMPGEVWTFDHDAGNPEEGWTTIDQTQQPDPYFRHVTDAIWDADPENVVAAPDFNTLGVAWVGLFGTEANTLCWQAGLGYGNAWCQRLYSPERTYSGGNVPYGWRHFNDTEEDYDYVNVWLRLLPSQEEGTNPLKQYTGLLGLAPGHPVDPPVGVLDSGTLTSSNFNGSTRYQIVFEMTADGGWSDEDASYPTEYGPAAFDDVLIGTTTYNFEDGLQGWTPAACQGKGTYFGIAPLGDYTIEDPCQCSLLDNILEMHDTEPIWHPEGQLEYAVSPIIDVLNDVTPGTLGGEGQLEIFVEWDQYSVMPRANGVLFRTGASYYPFLCEITNDTGWSPRVGEGPFHYVGTAPVCGTYRTSVTTVDANGTPVPTEAEQVRYMYELASSCGFFAIPESECTHVTNFTPILDNIKLCFTRVPVAPQISFGLGTQFQDGFAQGTQINDPSKAGRADATTGVTLPGDQSPIIAGDSLSIAGPVVLADGSNSWETQLWFRVARKGPLAGASYTDWRNQVNEATGVNIEAGQFASAFMDSSMQGTSTFKNKFASYLREDEWAAWGRTGPELTGNVEIIKDDVIYPGTQIEYFVSANFIGSTDKYLLPDTTGGNFAEFEILPNWRDVGGEVYKYPCLLYVDAYNRGAQVFIQAAVDSLGLEIDRYDYFDVTSNWKTPMSRGGRADATNGCTIPQLLGYRGILVNTGATNISGLMWPNDYAMFSDWLTAAVCGAEAERQGLIMNGDGIANSMNLTGASLLSRMGASHTSDWYADVSGNHSTCVRIESPLAGGELYGTNNSVSSNYDYDAYGNWCPQQFFYDVLGATDQGFGNRVYRDDSATETPFAQVVAENMDNENYRTIVDGVSWHHIAVPENGGVDRCVSSQQNITDAAFNEMAAALEWVFETDYDLIVPLCEDPCGGAPTAIDPPGSIGRGVTKLFQNSPNPFNPRTAIRFALATTGPAEISIFDVAGRKVRTLVKGELEAGSHEVVWDGTDDAGRPLTSGVYWTQLVAGGHTFNKKATVLR